MVASILNQPNSGNVRIFAPIKHQGPRRVASRFGSYPPGVNKQARKVLSLLKQRFPQAESFWQGHILVRNQDGQPTPAQIQLTQPEDAKQVDDWYEPKPQGRPWYKNPKWRIWWQARMNTPVNPVPITKEQTHKLVVNDNHILGVVHSIPNTPNPFGPGTITKAQGIRINPDCIKIDPTDQAVINEKPLYTGVGSALITHVIVQSLLHGDRGFGGNSTLGAEGFYHKLKLPHRPAEDGFRTYFYTEPEDALPFLERQFGKFQTMHDQIQHEAQTRKDS